MTVGFLVIFLERYEKITMFFQEVSSGFALAARAASSQREKITNKPWLFLL
jgi:hypothetical protein